jgi:SAM-dependent methyltransferase
MSYNARLWRIKANIYNRLRPRFILNAENRAVLELLEQLENVRITRALDLGCGVGNSIGLLGNTQHKPVALDRSLAMLKELSVNVPRINADILFPPFAGGRFELITAIGISEYFSDIDVLLQRIASLLVPKGYLLLTGAPRAIWTYLRFFSGHRLYPVSSKKIEAILRRHKLSIIQTSHTLLQVQYLLQKK